MDIGHCYITADSGSTYKCNQSVSYDYTVTTDCAILMKSTQQPVGRAGRIRLLSSWPMPHYCVICSSNGTGLYSAA